MKTSIAFLLFLTVLFGLISWNYRQQTSPIGGDHEASAYMILWGAGAILCGCVALVLVLIVLSYWVQT